MNELGYARTGMGCFRYICECVISCPPGTKWMYFVDTIHMSVASVDVVISSYIIICLI